MQLVFLRNGAGPGLKAWRRRCVAGLLSGLGLVCWAQNPEASSRAQPAPPPGIWADAANGDLAGMDAALAAGVPVDAQQPGPDARTPLMWALARKQWPAARHLLVRGANPNARTPRWSPLTWAYLHGREHTREATRLDTRGIDLLLEFGADINHRPEWGKSLLEHAASDYPPDPDAVRHLIARGAQVNSRNPQACETPLGMALYQAVGTPPGPAAALELARVLLQAGADPNLTADRGVAFGAGDMGGVSHDTPLLHATRMLRHGEEAAYRKALIPLLLQHGANPRVGGIGGAHPPYPEGCKATGQSGVAAAEWVGVPGSRANVALTELLANTAAHPAVFHAVVAAAGPLQPGEIGYPALHRQLVAKDSGGYAVHDQAAVERLLDLGAEVNPAWLLPDPEAGWNGHWRTNAGPGFGGLEALPLYADWLSDAVYRRLLEAGAEPGIAQDRFMSGADDSVVAHLIKRQAAGKLGLIAEHPGLLVRIPPWCGKAVGDIVRSLHALQAAPPSEAVRPTRSAARGLLLRLLAVPSCHTTPEAAAEAWQLAGQLNDPALLRSLSQHPDWQHQRSASGPRFRREPDSRR